LRDPSKELAKEKHTMALDQFALLELLEVLKAADADDVVRRGVESFFQVLIDAEATARIGAEPHQRTDTRVTQRNGYRDRVVTTAAGDVELRIPKLRAGSFFPSLLERRRRIDQALFAVVMEAYVTGTSTRKVDDLVVAMGADTGISKSEVSRICADLDVEVAAFRDRALAETAFPYVFLDATFCKARVGGDRRGRGSRVTAQAVVIATGVSADGRREVLGFDVGDSESGAFWTGFLRGLKARGLHGVMLVISDAHTGLKAAVGSILLGATWQRCRIHFGRNVLDAVPAGHRDMVAAAVRTIFAQPDAASVRRQLDVIAGMLGRQFPKVEAMLGDNAEDITAFADFPVAHWKKIWSTDESVNAAFEAGCAWVRAARFPPARRCLMPRPAAAVKVERPVGRTTLTAVRTAVASRDGGRGRPRSEEQGRGTATPATLLSLRASESCPGAGGHVHCRSVRPRVLMSCSSAR
jgi:transposase-like protein